MRAMSFAALPARSPCAAAAVACCDSTPMYTMARSGFLETVASPLVRMAGVMLEAASVADGEPVRTIGRLKAVMTAATTSEPATAMPTVTHEERICEPNVGAADEVTRKLRLGPRRGVEADVRHAPGAPVHPLPALQQLLVDEEAPDHPEVCVAPPKDLVHVHLGIEAARLKILHQPAQDHHALLALDRHREQPAGAIDEAAQHAVVGHDHDVTTRSSTSRAARGRGLGVRPVEGGQRRRVQARLRACDLVDLPSQRGIDRGA